MHSNYSSVARSLRLAICRFILLTPKMQHTNCVPVTYPPVIFRVFLYVCVFALQGKRVTAAKKCNHNINQPLQSGRNN